MPPLPSVTTLDEASDAELISRVREGDVGSYGTLFARHRDAANRLARSLTQPADADDVVADAFAKVLTALQDGKGPDEAFRPYLLTAVRTCHIDRRRFEARVTPTDDAQVLDAGSAFDDTAVAGFEGGAAAEAFRSLPERWQLVLWHLDVEGQKPAAVAPLLGMAPNAVSALAYRAREGLREAFLQQHAAEAEREECRRTHALLAGAVRGNLSRRDRKRVEAHLEECRRCTALYLELTEVNSSLRGLIAPVVLGGAAAAYLAGTPGAGVGLAGVGALLGRVRDTVTSHTQAALAAGAAAAAAVAAVTGMVLLHTDAGRAPSAPQADAPASVAPPAPTPGTGPRTHPSPGSLPATTRDVVTATGPVRSVPAAAAAVSGGAAGGIPTGPRPAGTPVGPSRPPRSSPPAAPAPGPPTTPPTTPPTPPSPAPRPGSGGDSSTVAIRAGVAPGGGGAPVTLGVQVGQVPAAHLAALDLDLAGQHVALAVP